jgi:hypothetical protein
MTIECHAYLGDPTQNRLGFELVVGFAGFLVIVKRRLL